MAWSDVAIARAEWRIDLTKNGESQTVFLSSKAVEILAERKRKATSKFVFAGDSKSGHMEEPKGAWRRILDRDELNQLIKRIELAGAAFDRPAAEPLALSLKRAQSQAGDLGLNTDGTRLLDLRIHDLRRTLGSWQAAAGASLVIIGKSLNQKSVSSTAIYARLNLDPVRESVNRATGNMVATLNTIPIVKAAQGNSDSSTFFPECKRSIGPPIKIFIDTEFSNLEDPRLISLALVMDSGEEMYAELTPLPDGCSDFVCDIVLPLLSRERKALCELDALPARILAWLNIVRQQQEIEVCYDSDFDWNLFLGSLNGNLPAYVKPRPVQAEEIDVPLRHDYHKKNNLPQHHALYDARAFRHCCRLHEIGPISTNIIAAA